MPARHLALAGRLLFALAVIGLGIEHFVFGEFVTGRAPAWPADLPGRLAWAYASGAVVAAAGAALLAGKRARSAGILLGTLILIWAFLRHLPVVAGDASLGAAWTGAGKALALFGGAFAIAGTLPVEGDGRNPLERFIYQGGKVLVLGRVCLGSFLVLAGIQHFLFIQFVASLIPRWFPGDAVFWGYFAGVALLAGGVGLFLPPTARWAALLSGLMVFSWFWIIHVPRALTSVSDAIAVFEALAVSGIAFAIAGAESRPRPAAAADRT